MTRTLLRSSALLLLSVASVATLAGCWGGGGNDSRPSLEQSIPPRAPIVRVGRGTLEYTADADGELFVQDAKTEKTILTRRVKRGEKIAVMPRENRIRLNGDTNLKTDLKRDNDHRIYFQRDSRPEDETNNTRNGRDGVPIGARLIGEDMNNEISFKAERTGRAYIVDADKHKVVETLTVGEGRRFTFSPGADRATLDGRAAI